MSSFFEIVELSDGSIELRRLDDDEAASSQESLVKIQFSDQTSASLGQYKAAIAKAMLQAGLEEVANISGMQFETSEVSQSDQRGDQVDRQLEGQLKRKLGDEITNAVDDEEFEQNIDKAFLHSDSGTLH